MRLLWKQTHVLEIYSLHLSYNTIYMNMPQLYVITYEISDSDGVNIDTVIL